MTPEDYLRSPCIKVCKTKVDNDTLICSACLRTIEEITNWSSFTDKKRSNY